MRRRDCAVQAASRARAIGSKTCGKRVRGMNDRLRKAFDGMIAGSANVVAPAEIERELLAEFDRVNLPRVTRRKKSWTWMVLAGAAAASVAVVLVLEHRPELKPPAAPAAVSEDVRGSEQ